MPASQANTILSRVLRSTSPPSAVAAYAPLEAAFMLLIWLCASSRLALELDIFTIGEAIRKETAVPIRKLMMTMSCPPLGATASSARMEPGDAGLTRPTLKMVLKNICRYGAADGSEEQQGVHQNIREVDLVDTAEYVHDQSAGSGVLSSLILGEHPVSEQDACACAGVGLDQVEYGLSKCLDLLSSERCEDTVVDRVVQEQDLSGLYEDRYQRKESCIDKDVNAALQEYQNSCHNRADQVEAYDCEEHAQDTDGEVVYQHLEACLNLAFDRLVELLDDPAAQRACQHRAHQHGIIGSAADNADAGDRTHDRASLTADHLAACVSDQDREHIGQHRAYH